MKKKENEKYKYISLLVFIAAVSVFSGLGAYAFYFHIFKHQLLSFVVASIVGSFISIYVITKELQVAGLKGELKWD